MKFKRREDDDDDDEHEETKKKIIFREIHNTFSDLKARCDGSKTIEAEKPINL